MFWHEIIQVNVSVINIQIILSEHFHFYKLISRWVPEMMVQILTTFVHKFSGFVHPTFIKLSHLMGGWGVCRTPKWVSLVMKLREFNPSKSPDHRKTAPLMKTYSKDIPNFNAE